MKLVSLVTSIAGLNFSFPAGTPLECDEATAERLIDSHQATEADAAKTDPETICRFPDPPQYGNKRKRNPTPTLGAIPKVDSLDLDVKTASTLADGLAELPEDGRPIFVSELVNFDKQVGLEELTGIGKVAAGKIRVAIKAALPNGLS